MLKMGRTENQDAVPMTLGQEFGAYAVMIGDGMAAPRRASVEELLRDQHGRDRDRHGHQQPARLRRPRARRRLAEVTGLPLTKAANLVEATQDSGEFAQMAGTMKRAAVQLSKICNDLRWLSSGPRCGLNEIHLPPMQPGSSIMPGKVNPVIPEVVSQICYQIIGYDVTISMASEASELELNMAEPIIAYNLLHRPDDAEERRVVAAQPAASRASRRTASAASSTCRTPSASSPRSIPCSATRSPPPIAKEALKTGGSVYDLVIEKGWLTSDELNLLPTRAR